MSGSGFAFQESATVAADAAGSCNEHSAKITSKGREYWMRIFFRKSRYDSKTAPPLVASLIPCEMQPMIYAVLTRQPCCPAFWTAGSVALRPTLSNGLPLSSLILMSTDPHRLLWLVLNKNRNWFEGYSLRMSVSNCYKSKQKRCQAREKEKNVWINLSFSITCLIYAISFQ